MKNKSPTRDKNPLAVLFAAALKQLRGTLSSTEIARRLSISESAYRLVESANILLQPVYAPRLIRTFQTIVWSRVTTYIVCAQTVESQGKQKSDQMWEVAKTIAELDADLNLLINRDLQSIAAAPGKYQTTQSIPRRCIQSLINFLEGEPTSRTVPGHADGANSAQDETLAKWAARAPSWVSPIALEMALNQLQTMRYFPSYVPPDQFDVWESEHYTAFANVYAFISNLSEIADLASNYHWDYLDLQTFGQVHILVPKSQEYSQAHAKLINTIASIKSGSERAWEAVQKIRTDALDEPAVRDILKFLRYDLKRGQLHYSDDALPLENAWLYELRRSKVIIGFADNYRGQNDFVSVMLTKGEVETLVRKIVDPWDSIGC